ncbi:hypothetical protein F5884DRAFT_549580 [Xylogone sp. PMI_703]|nr:hypothetical protein F5884DRAFT_549580 [Xylogone sp. PMI_703]
MRIRQLNVCQQCRLRKLGCDGKRPFCSQCMLKGRKCSGYQSDLIFRPPQVSSPRPTGSIRTQDHTTKRREFRKSAKLTKIRIDYSSIVRPLSWPLCDVISLCAQNFIPENELSLSSNTSSLSQSRICGTWIEVLPSLAGNGGNEYLDSAIKALGISIVARGSEGRAPASDALEAQCSALQALQKNIKHASKSAFNELAAAIMCLFLSEMLLPTSSVSSVVHAVGISELIQLQQPSFYAFGISHRLFTGFRPLLVLHAFATRTPTFLAVERWKIEPFCYIPVTPLQALFNDGSIIPAILERLDNAKLKSVDIALITVSVSISQLVEILDRLSKWYEQVLTSSEMSLWWTRSGVGDETYLWFSNITVANSLTHFWAFWIICIANIRQLREQYPSLRERELQVDGQIPESEYISTKIIEMSANILQSVEYLTQEKMKLFGATSAFLPLQTACDALGIVDGSGDSGCFRKYQRVIEIIKRSEYQDILIRGLGLCSYPKT